MEERGVEVDHATLNRWVVKYSPQVEKGFRQHKHPVGTSWRLDEAYVRIKGSGLRVVIDQAHAPPGAT